MNIKKSKVESRVQNVKQEMYQSRVDMVHNIVVGFLQVDQVEKL